MTRYTYDTEFLEDGKTVELISIGIVCIDDGREYYAVNADMPQARVRQHDWLMKNVWPSLPLRENEIDISHPQVKPKAKIADEVLAFINAGQTSAELWAYYASFDHIALTQLWGTMMELPDGIPMWTNDIQSQAYLHRKGLPYMRAGKHNALEDARFNVVRYNALVEAGAISPFPRSPRKPKI